MLSRFVVAFLPTSKHLLISLLQSPSAVILNLPSPQLSFEESTGKKEPYLLESLNFIEQAHTMCVFHWPLSFSIWYSSLVGTKTWRFLRIPYSFWFFFLSFLVYQFSPCERPYHWEWFFSLPFVMQVQSQLPCQHCFLELMVPSPPPVVFSQTFWTSVPSLLCFLGPGRQPISFDPSDPRFSLPSAASTCFGLRILAGFSGFLKVCCGSLALRLWRLCISVLGSFLELHSLSSSWACVHALPGPRSYCLLPASVMVSSSLTLSHGLAPTSLHNGPWFLLPFFLLSGLVTWGNFRCFHVLLILILHFFEMSIRFVLSFPYTTSWAVSLLP